MGNDEEYRFTIKAYSPDTIPMVRLAEYMLEFGKLLANDDRVHFKGLEAGSTVLVTRVEHEAVPKIEKRVRNITLGDIQDDALKIFNNLNKMLRDDNAMANLTRRAANDERFIDADVLKFPGCEIPVPVEIGPLTETAFFDGELERIGGRDETAHATIVDAEGRRWNGELSRDLAQKIAQYLYQGPILRVEGEARWLRTEVGRWELKKFVIREFRVLPSDTLIQAVDRLRSVKGSEWGNIDDPNEFISEQRDNGDELH